MSSSTIASRLRKHESCCTVNRLSENGCVARIPPGPNFIVSGDRYQEEHQFKAKLCDGVVIYAGDDSPCTVVLVELKSGKAPASDVVKQLQGGISVAIKFVGADCPSSWRPVLLHQGLKSMEVRQYKRLRVKWRGESKLVELRRCGSDIGAW